MSEFLIKIKFDGSYYSYQYFSPVQNFLLNLCEQFVIDGGTCRSVMRNTESRSDSNSLSTSVRIRLLVVPPLRRVAPMEFGKLKSVEGVWNRNISLIRYVVTLCLIQLNI